MGATNTTANYSLSQFISTDKPAWLQDYNGDMLKIDTAINAAKLAADTAQSTATNAQTDATSAVNSVSALASTVSSLSTAIGGINGTLNTITSLIGNGVPTTTDQTIIGAINELHSNQGNLANLQTTDKSSLVAAINEAAQSGGGGGGSSASDFGTVVDLTSYNSFANAYTFPSEGYVYANAPGTAGNVDIKVFGANATADTDASMLIASIQSQSNSAYVRKDMKCYVNVYGSDPAQPPKLQFIPLE